MAPRSNGAVGPVGERIGPMLRPRLRSGEARCEPETAMAEPRESIEPPGRGIDEAQVRARVSEIADTCGGCRRCTDRCPVFPTLFDLLDRAGDGASMTPDDQDRALDPCWQCGRCLDGCPFGPGIHETGVDVAGAVRQVRAAAVVAGRVAVRDRLGDRLLGRPDLVGRLAGGSAGIVVRQLLRCAARVGRVRLELPTRRERIVARPITGRGDGTDGDRPDVVVFPSCPVQYGSTGVGRALVSLLARTGTPHRISSAGCCGAPWLHSGDLGRFDRTVARTADRLAGELGEDTVVLVPQPACAEALATVAPGRSTDPVVARVAARVEDPVRHVLGSVRDGLSTAPEAPVVTGGSESSAPERTVRVTHHVACRSVDDGASVAELLTSLGVDVQLVRRCSGVGDAWGARTSRQRQIEVELGGLVDDIGGSHGSENGRGVIVTSECRHTAAALEAAGVERVMHPLELAEHLCAGGSKLPLAEPPDPF